jgi:hypothetical protein
MGISSIIKNMYKDFKIFKIFVHISIGLFRLAFNFVILLFHKIYHSKNRVHIAFIAPIHSPHFVNFLHKVEQHFVNDNIKIIQINSDPNYLKRDFSFNKLIIDGSIYTLFGYYLSREVWQKTLFLNAVNKIGSISVRYIALNIACFKPDILWIHDLQSGGYLVDNFIDHFRKNNASATICGSVYGNDLYFFENSPLHNNKLRCVTKNLDFLHIESEREKAISRKLGFTGKFFPVSNITMTDVQNLRNLESDSKLAIKDIFVVIKGSYFWRSNLLCILDEIERDFTFWKNKKIYVVNVTDEDIFHLLRVRNKLDLDLDYSKAIPHKDFVSLLIRAKFFLTLNLSDGIPNAVVEATYVNCIPVFSNHTGLSNSLNNHISHLIVFEFAKVNFKHLFTKLSDLNEVDVIFLINSLKMIFENNLFNDRIQRGILDDVLEHARRKLYGGAFVKN